MFPRFVRRSVLIVSGMNVCCKKKQPDRGVNQATVLQWKPQKIALLIDGYVDFPFAPWCALRVGKIVLRCKKKSGDLLLEHLTYPIDCKWCNCFMLPYSFWDPKKTVEADTTSRRWPSPTWNLRGSVSRSFASYWRDVMSWSSSRRLWLITLP